MGRHTLTADVPAGMGGRDRAPIPSQFFVASLGSCIGAFVLQYCEQHKINDEGMWIEISYDRADDPTRLVNLKASVMLPNADCGRHLVVSESILKYCPVYATIRTMQSLEVELLGKGLCDLAPESSE